MTMMLNALSRTVTVANGKGGAGKTSVAVNVAGLAAAAGWRTLFLDFDPQGNAGTDFGYTWSNTSDHGEHLVDAVVTGRDLRPVLPNVRENLDVVCGGEALDDLESIVTGRAQRAKDFRNMLSDVLAPLAKEYDLIIIDTPPTRPNLTQLVFGASRWVIVPTRADRASIEGLRVLGNQLRDVRPINPDLEILGATLFDVSTSATVIRRNAAEDITSALGDAAPLFKSVIRHSESAAVEAREKGMLVHELADSVENAEPYWKALKDGRRPARIPGSAPVLAGDYVLLCQEVLKRIDELENAEVSA